MADTTARIRLALEGQGQVVQGLKQVEDGTASLKRSMASLVGGLSLGAAVGQLVQVQREFDVLNSSLITVTGSSAAAQREMKWIKDFAASTPYGLNEVTSAFVKMKALGLDPSQKALTSYGNTASAMGRGLNQMIEAVADASTSQFERLLEFGIKAKQNGDQVSLTFRGVTTSIGNNSAEITAYLQKLGNTDFAGATVTRAATLDGAISNLGDSWDELFRTVNEAGVGNLMAQSASVASAALGGLSATIRENKSEIAALTGALSGAALLAALPAMAGGLKLVAGAVVTLGIALASNPLTLTLLGIGAAVGAVAGYSNAVSKTAGAIRKTITELERLNKMAADQPFDAVLNANVAKRSKEIEELRGKLRAMGADARASFAASDPRRVSDFGQYFTPDAPAVKEIIPKITGQTAAEKALTEQQKQSAEVVALRNKLVEQGFEASQKNLEAARAADADLVRQYANAAASAQQRLTDLEHEAEAVAFAERNQIGLAQAVELTTIARLKEQQVGAMGNEAIVLQLQAEIEAREKIVGMLNSTDVRDAGRELRKNEAAEWARTWDQVGQSFTDALMQGGKSVSEYLKDLFRTLVLRPILAPIGGSVASLFGGSASAGTGGVGGVTDLLGMVKGFDPGKIFSNFSDSLAFMADSAGQWLVNNTSGLLNQMGGQLMGNAGAIGTIGGVAGGALAAIGLGRAISGGYSAFKSQGVSDLLSLAGGGLVSGAVNRLFGRKLKDSGITGEFGGDAGFSGSQYQFFKGGLFRSDKTKTSALDDELRTALASQYELLSDNTSGMAGQLKLSASALETYTRKVKFSTKGLTQDQITQRITEEFEAMGEEMAQLVLGTTKYTREGEAASATLVRLSTSLTGANALLGVVGQTLFGVGLVGADMASQLADKFGGLDAMAQATAAYYQTYYTASERADAATAALTAGLGTLGLSLPNTNAGFRALVDGLDLTTEHGRTTYAALLQMAPEFAALQVELQRLADETAAQLIAAFTGRGRLVPVLDGAALSVAAMSGGVELAQLRAGRLGSVSDALALSFDAARITTAALNTGMTRLGVQQLLVQAGTGTLAGSLTDTQVRALALATGLTEAQVRAGALAGGAQGLAAQLAAAAAQALGFAGPVSTINRLLGDAASGVLVFGDQLDTTTSALTPAQAAVAALHGEVFALRTAASGTVVDVAGLAEALATVDTRAFVATVVGVFDLIGQRIKDTLASISDERSALREAAMAMVAPGVMTAKQIGAQVKSSMVGLPSNAGIISAQTSLAKADALTKLRQDQQLAAARKLTEVQAAAARSAQNAASKVSGAQNGLTSLYNSSADVRRLTGYNVNRLVDGSIAAGTRVASKFGAYGGSEALTAMLADKINALTAAQKAQAHAAQKWAADTATAQARLSTAAGATKAATSAAAAAATAAKNAQLTYIDALQKYSLDASKAVANLGRLREETVKYYESQKELFTLMTGAASSLRSTVAAFRFDQLDPMAQFNSLQERYNVAYSMAMSTTGETLAGYGDEMNSLLRPLLDKAQEAGVGGSAYSNLVKTVLARAEATATRLEANAPKDYAAESLGLLGQIDSTLAALEAGAMTADRLIVNAINAGRDSTRDGLRAVVEALTGQAVPAFAMGGMHAGGIRLVGENGPELEVTGPSRIYSAAQTRGMLGGADTGALVQEIRALRVEVGALRADNKVLQTQIMTNTGKTARQLDRWDGEGLPVKNLDGETLAVKSA